MKRYLIISLIILQGLVNFPEVAVAQTAVYDLKKCIDEAVTNNISLKISSLEVEMQRHTLNQSRAARLPSLTANATHGYNWGQTIDLYTNQFASERVQSNNFYLQSGITIFNGFSLLNQSAQQQYNLMARQLDRDKTLNNIILNVSTAYMQVLYNGEQVSIAQGQLEITRQQVARTRIMVEEGALATGELLAMESQLAAEEVNLVRAENALSLSYLTLAQMMNLPAETSFMIAIPDIENWVTSETLLLNPEQIFRLALDIRPEIMSADVMVKSAEKGVLVAKGTALPSLYLNASMGTGFSGARKDYSYAIQGFEPNGMFTSGFDTVFAPVLSVNEKLRPFGDQINDNFNQSVALYLTIPLFNGLQNYTNTKRAEIALANAKYSLDLQKQQLMQEIQQAHADALAALKGFEASKRSLAAMKESFRYAEEKFSVGLINSMEYNDAKNRLMSAEAQMLGARYEYLFKTRLLDFYMGKEIHL